MTELNQHKQWPYDERLPAMPGREDCRYNLADLSHEEFSWLAQHRPELTMPSIYVLQFTYRWRHNHCYKKPRKYEGDWQFNISRGGRSYHSSLQAAEKALLDYIQDEEGISTIHSATIKRMPIDVSYRDAELEWWLISVDEPPLED